MLNLELPYQYQTTVNPLKSRTHKSEISGNLNKLKTCCPPPYQYIFQLIQKNWNSNKLQPQFVQVWGFFNYFPVRPKVILINHWSHLCWELRLWLIMIKSRCSVVEGFPRINFLRGLKLSLSTGPSYVKDVESSGYGWSSPAVLSERSQSGCLLVLSSEPLVFSSPS